MMNNVEAAFLTVWAKTMSAAHREEGAGLAEYALLLALIAVVCVGSITILGTSIDAIFAGIAGTLN